VTDDPVGDIIGDYRGFAAMQHERLLERGIDIGPYALSHLAVRVPEWDQYLHVRMLLERHATASNENVWNGRPISLIVLATPLEILGGKIVSHIELIPPVHQRVYRMGLEHLGVVVGEEVDAFSREHRAALPLVAVRRHRPGGGDLRRLRPCRGLGPAAARHGDRPETAASLTTPFRRRRPGSRPAVRL